MIQRVYEQTQKAIEEVVVATDDDRIAKAVEDFGGRVVMTGSHHQTGTNRCLEALEICRSSFQLNPDIIINVQGDEPLLQPDQISSLVECFDKEGTELATLIIPVSTAADLFNESECFVVFDKAKNALYFSRSVIPHIRGYHKTKWLEHHTFYKHLGMYAYTPDSLRDFAEMEMTPLEQAESLEQNRWLENGRKIAIAITEHDSIPVDTIDDLEKVREIIRQKEGH